MMRLADIEDMLVNGDVSDERVEKFKVALKRCPRDYRAQIAIQLPFR